MTRCPVDTDRKGEAAVADCAHHMLVSGPRAGSKVVFGCGWAEMPEHCDVESFYRSVGLGLFVVIVNDHLRWVIVNVCMYCVRLFV